MYPGAIITLLWVLPFVCVADLSGRWILDNNLGVFTLTPLTLNKIEVYTVENQMWRIRSWHFGTLLRDNTTLTLKVDNENEETLEGTLWPNEEGTQISWSNKTSWHFYGSDVICVQPTKKRLEFTQEEDTFNNETVNTKVTQVHLIIMTHFDLGYTDYSWCVVSQYFWRIYPGIVQTALVDPTFIYTTHPWLLYLYFNCDRLKNYIINVPQVEFFCPTPSMVSALGEMIQRGQLVWHAFAYDGFNELLGETMFSIGFNFSQWLSLNFKVPPVITMSNIDIPGIYRAQLPTMINNNVKALYIGQNPFDVWAGAVLQLPNLFRWQSPTNPNDYIVTLTHKLGYGGLTPFDAVIDTVSGHALVVQCVLENSPAYTPIDVSNYVHRVQRYFPNAVVAPSTFDNFVREVLPHASQLDTISLDIGDTWVRAVPSDPIKTSTFLEQRRDFEQCIASSQCNPNSLTTLDEVFFLMTAAEHNWGLPCQTNSWETTTLSYQEKRDFLKSAKKVRPNNMSQVPPKVMSSTGVPPCGIVEFDEEAAVKKLQWNGVDYANDTHRLGVVLYTEHATQGLNGTDLATGWGDPIAKFLVFNSTPHLISTSGDGCLLFKAISSLNQNDTYVGPMMLFHTLQIFPNNNSITFTVEFSNKALSYHMYATWGQKYSFGNAVSIQFRPVSNDTVPPPWRVNVLGVDYSPSNFAPNGTSHFHIADSTTFSNILTIRPLDTPFLMFGNNSASFVSNWDSLPDYSTGAWFNVFNQWNANWVVGWPWNSEVISTRYQIIFPE